MPNSKEIDDLLWDAVYDGDLDALRKLVDAGADIDHVSISDLSVPLLYIALVTKTQQIEVNMRFVNFLIAAGADVNIRYGNNNSVLDYATNRGISTAVAALLEAGADVNFWYAPGSSFDQFKHSPVGMAVILGRRGILLDLLRAGAILPKEFVQKVEVPTSPVRKTATLCQICIWPRGVTA